MSLEHSPARRTDSAVADDLMLGAGPIAEFIYGKDTPETRRNVYRNPFGFGFFKHGNTLAALKSNTRAELAEAQRIAREAPTRENEDACGCEAASTSCARAIPLELLGVPAGPNGSGRFVV